MEQIIEQLLKDRVVEEANNMSLEDLLKLYLLMN